MQRLYVVNRQKSEVIKTFRILVMQTVWLSAPFDLSCFCTTVFFNALFSLHQQEELLTALCTDEEL